MRGCLKRVVALVAVVRFGRALATSLGRGRILAGWRGAAMVQPATITRMDRHPVLFALVAERLSSPVAERLSSPVAERLSGHAAARLSDNTAPRLLSFGCSTGEEAFTLARYCPGATIDALDANPACIAQARRAADHGADQSADRLHRKRIRFLCADTPDAVAPDQYDAVFCLSVLRHGDLESRPALCTALVPFARFAALVAALDARVRVGGLLVLWGCNFRFADTPTALRYRSVPSPAVEPHPGPFYGPDDRLLPDDRTASFVFVKSG